MAVLEGFQPFSEIISFEFVTNQEDEDSKTEDLTFDEAVQNCKSKGASLAYIDNVEEFEFIRTIVQSHIQLFPTTFIAYSLAYQAPLGFIDGSGSDFLALNGAANASFFAKEKVFPWDSNSPSLDLDSSECVGALEGVAGGILSQGLWFSASCTQRRPHICRRDSNENNEFTAGPTINIDITRAPTTAAESVEDEFLSTPILAGIGAGLVLSIFVVILIVYKIRKNKLNEEEEDTLSSLEKETHIGPKLEGFKKIAEAPPPPSFEEDIADDNTDLLFDKFENADTDNMSNVTF